MSLLDNMRRMMALWNRKEKTFVSEVYGVSLRYPAGWKQVDDTRFEGLDGFFQVGAAGTGTITLDEIVQGEVGHVLKPYGSHPVLKRQMHRGLQACLILPSHDQPKENKGQAAFLVQYPSPVTISGQAYRFFVLYADKRHVRTMAESVRFR